MNKDNKVAACFMTYLFLGLFGSLIWIPWKYRQELGILDCIIITVVSAPLGIICLIKLWKQAVRNELM